MAPDRLVMPALEQLATCLCAELAQEDTLPGLCFCGVLWGGAPADYVNTDTGEGMAWVSLTSASPQMALGQAYTEPTCDAPLGFVVEMGVAFCAPAPTSRGALPSIAEHLESVRMMTTAMGAMRRALICCFESVDDVLLGQFQPLGPQGGVIGGTWSVTLPQGVAWS